MNDEDEKIIASQISEEKRMAFLPRFMGNRMLTFENAVYTFADKFCDAYHGGYWRFYELSNGGFYIAPQVHSPVRVSVDSNGFEGDVSADGFGVICTLFALNALLWSAPDEVTEKRYYALRDYADQHPDAAEIYGAID